MSFSRPFFIHSFGHFYSAPSSPLLLRGAPDYSTGTVSEFHAEAHRQLQVKNLPKVPTWRLARAGVEPTTLRLKVIVSTKTPPHPNRQLLVKDLPKVPTWRLEWDSNLRPSERKAPNLPIESPCTNETLQRLIWLRLN